MSSGAISTCIDSKNIFLDFFLTITTLRFNLEIITQSRKVMLNLSHVELSLFTRNLANGQLKSSLEISSFFF